MKILMLGVIVAQSNVRVVKTRILVYLFPTLLRLRFKAGELRLNLLWDKTLLKNIISLSL